MVVATEDNHIYKNIRAQGGFSLIELIIVIAIMAVLLGLLTPAFVKYIDKQRRSTCRQNREAILKIYENGVYDSATAIGLNETDLDNVVNGNFSYCKNDVAQYTCPKKGTYSSFFSSTDTSVACIECSECGDVVSLDMLGWSATSPTLGVDMLITPTPGATPTTAPTVAPTVAPTPTPTTKGGSNWPYPDLDEWWDGTANDLVVGGNYTNNDINNLYINMKAPSVKFQSRAGGWYVFIDVNNAGYNQIYYKEAQTPEYYSALYPQRLIQLSGTEISWNLDKQGTTITEMTNGDIYTFTSGGTSVSYVYFHTAGGGQSESFNISELGNNKVGNFYKIGGQ